MIELTTIQTNPTVHSHEKCRGGCIGCGKTHIKILGAHDTNSQLLRTQVEEALRLFPMEHKIIEVSEPNAIAAAGVTVTPAMLLDGQLMVQGRVPSAEELVDMFQERYLHRSKLHRLTSIAVAVDISAGSDSALRFAWQIAQKTRAMVEVVYVMDSIFEGQAPSGSGFLSGYKHTMQVELDVFIRDTMARIGVKYEPPIAGAPGIPTAQNAPAIRSKVIYGFADAALEECSRNADLLVLGTTGRGAIGKKLFGSVSTEVSKRSHCPVLLVPPYAEFQGLKQVLYASNYDSLNTLRIQQAISFTDHFDGQVHFVHVGPGAEKSAAIQHESFESSYRKSHPVQPFIFAKMVSDDVLGSLYEYAFYHHIEMMVFVTHQRNAWENIMHHSITREAAASTDLPILIIHSDDDMLG